MRHFFWKFVLFSALLPLAVFSQSKKGFEVKGHLEGLRDGEIVRLGNRFKDWHYFTPIDSCIIQNGSFQLKGEPVPEGPRVYELLFDSGRHRIANPNGKGNIGGIAIDIFVDNGDLLVIDGGDINIMRDADFQDEISITGSLSHTARAAMLPTAYKYWTQYALLNKEFAKIQDSTGFDRFAVNRIIEAKFKLDRELDSLLVISPGEGYKPAFPSFINFQDNYHAFFLKDLYNSLDAHAQKSYDGKILKSNARLAIGQPLPDFILPDPDGKKIALKDIIAKSKVTLVHLWASNSFDRDKYQQELFQSYKKYHNKGLNIIGVSADSVADDWKFIVHQKKYPWVNVSDLKGNLEGGIVQDVYHEGGHSIPNTTNILLDAGGKIIAWDANGLELQWYLWKYLGD